LIEEIFVKVVIIKLKLTNKEKLNLKLKTIESLKTSSEPMRKPKIIGIHFLIQSEKANVSD
jgi:hypothetical protein